ncbi:hypothetical protein ERJ75_001117800 [Trypanosoma vivax]|nr:hypothetical protein ERJ75_001117800 [Trypanosoma vivax]
MTCGQRVRAVHAESDACSARGRRRAGTCAGRRRHKRKDAAARPCRVGVRVPAGAVVHVREGGEGPRVRHRVGAVQHSDGARGDQRGSGERSGRHEAAARLFEQLEARGQRGERGDTDLTVAGEAEKLARVAEGMGDIEHEALAVAGAAARTSVRLTDFVKLFATFSGSVNGGGKTCIGKATGSNQDAATANGPADYIYASLGCDVSPQDMATMKAHIIQHGTAPAQVGTRTIKGATLSDQVQQPASIALETGVDTAATGRMPTRNAQGTQKCRHRRRHRGRNNGGAARKVDWAGLIEMTPSSTSTNSGTNADAATTMEWKNDALAALGTIATRYAKVRQQAIDATKACEATKRCKEPSTGQERHGARKQAPGPTDTGTHRKTGGTGKGENEAQTCANSGEVFDAQRGRCVVAAETHSGKAKQHRTRKEKARRRKEWAQRGRAWPRPWLWQ